jgi:TatA/E family protein of Tat protein translocase
MFNLGPFELVAIFVVALLVFGPDKLPEMGKQVGKAVREFRKFQESMNSQVRDVLEPISGPIMGNGNVVGPQPTNIRGTIPTELPPDQQAAKNVPRSATIQNPEAGDGEEAAPPGTYGHYALPNSEGSAPAAPAAGEAAPAGEATPPASPTEPDSR